MHRRFQFSLRTLLATIGLASVCLGAWRIYAAHFASLVEAETARVGQPIVLRGRFFLKQGTDSADFQVAAVPWQGGAPTVVTGATTCRAQRDFFGIYRFSEPAMCSNASHWTEPGDFGLYAFLPDGRYIAGHVSVKP
jgi:hypothetical protein